MNDNDETVSIPQDSSAPEPAPSASGDELAEILEAVEDAREAREHKYVNTAGDDARPARDKTSGQADAAAPEPASAGSEISAEAAAAEQSGNYVYPDSGAASSQRLRLIPPDGKPPSWWARNRKNLNLLEMILTGMFFLLALYFLYLWIFS